MTYLHHSDDDDFVEVEGDLELERIDPRPIEDDIDAVIGREIKRDEKAPAKREELQKEHKQSPLATSGGRATKHDEKDDASIHSVDTVKNEEDDVSLADVASINTQTSSPEHAEAFDLAEIFDEKMGFTEKSSRMEVGNFSTDDVRPWNQPRPFNLSPRKFTQPFSLDGPYPTVVHGLNGLDISKSRNIRVRASSSDISSFGFTVHNNSWEDTVLYRASSSFIATDGLGSDVDAGTVNVHEGFHQTEKSIKFNTKFSAPPTVLVWLSGLDVEKGRNMRVKCLASSVKEEGFKLSLEGWCDTLLHNGTEATWFAFSEGKQGVTSGRFHSQLGPGELSKGKIKFVPDGEREIFKKAPKIFLAFDYLDVDKKHNTRVWLKADKVTKHGFEWTIQAWADTRLYMVGATWIAVE